MATLTRRADGRYMCTKVINGKRVFFYSAEYTPKKAEHDMEKQMLEYREKEEKGKTFKEVSDEWERKHEKEISAGTQKRYKPCIRRANEQFGDKYIKDITARQISVYIHDFAKKYTASKTVKMQQSVINLIFKYAVLNEYIGINVCQYVEIPKHLMKGRRDMPDDKQIQKVKDSLNCTFGLFAFLILYTGLRRGEALALEYSDIDFDNNIIHVTKSLTHISNEPIIGKTKTEAGIRDVVLLQCLKDALPKKKKERVGILFPNEKGEYLHQSNFNRLWKKYKTESGVSITPHQLRHAYATILYYAGIGDKDAQQLMGHTNITLTRDIYTHISSQRLGETESKLNEYVCSQEVVKE